MVTRSPDSVARQYVIEAKLAVASLMERNGLSQSDVARIIGRSQAAVSRWLDPENSQFFDLHHYAVLCIYLQIPPAVVLPPADWTAGKHQELLKRLIKLNVTDLDFILRVYLLAKETYQPPPKPKEKAP